MNQTRKVKNFDRKNHKVQKYFNLSQTSPNVSLTQSKPPSKHVWKAHTQKNSIVSSKMHTLLRAYFITDFCILYVYFASLMFNFYNHSCQCGSSINWTLHQEPHQHFHHKDNTKIIKNKRCKVRQH